MVAIFTKFVGPTATKSSRIIATAGSGHQRMILSKGKLEDQTGSNDPETIHRAAAQALADKLDWRGELVAGGYRDGYVFTFKVKDRALMSHRDQLLGVRDTLLAWADSARLSLKFAKPEDEAPFKNQLENYTRLADRVGETAEYLRGKAHAG